MEFNLELDPITQAITQAQEQLQAAMEVQYWEEQMWQWMEKDWESQMVESRLVVSDKESAIEAAEQAVVEIGKKFQKVSLGFLWLYLEF